MDAKYGRLFTEADVKRLMRYAYQKGQDGEVVHADPEGIPVDAGAVLLMLYEQELALDDSPFAGVGALAFPADEPLFLLRGKDRCTPKTIINGYLQEVWRAGAPREHIEATFAAAVDISAWQHNNLDKVKVPD